MTNTDDVLGLKNHLVGGLSFDGAQTEFSATAFLGGLVGLDRAFAGPGVTIDEPGVNTPVRLATSDAYYGLYFSDTLNLTRPFAVTVSGRFNAAEIDLSDQGGGSLTGQHTYNRFNPAVGRHLRSRPLAHSLRRLLRSEPRAHARRAVPAQVLQTIAASPISSQATRT